MCPTGLDAGSTMMANLAKGKQMADTHEDHGREARELLALRIQEMRAYLDAIDPDKAPAGRDPETGAWVDGILEGYDDAYEAIADYGLEWTKYITNHVDETVTYHHVLSTGGPHDEFQVTFDPAKGTVDNVTYVYKPWFGRVEIPVVPTLWGTVPVPLDVARIVHDFYATFYADLIYDDTVNERREWS